MGAFALIFLSPVKIPTLFSPYILQNSLYLSFASAIKGVVIIVFLFLSRFLLTAKCATAVFPVPVGAQYNTLSPCNNF